MDPRSRNIREIHKQTQRTEPEHVSVGFYIRLCVYNNLGDFISHISSHRVRCLSVDGCTWLTGKREDLPHWEPLSSKYSRRVWLSVSIPHIVHPRVSRTLYCCVTLKARWPEGGGCLLCQSSKARLAIFIPLQGQFAVCDLSKGNVTWQELLTSEEHLRVSEDMGYSYSFRVYPFVIFKIGFPLVFCS